MEKAQIACEVSGHLIENYFPDVRKMVQIGSGSQREIDDVMLTPPALPITSSFKKLNQTESKLPIIWATVKYAGKIGKVAQQSTSKK